MEKDPVLAAHLRQTLGTQHPQTLHLIEGDAVEHALAALPGERATSGAFKIVANLPYAIATPWMDAVLGGPLPARMVLMVQQEAVQRYSAQPGTKQFGAISIFLQAAFDPRTRTSRVGHRAFTRGPRSNPNCCIWCANPRLLSSPQR